MTLCFFKHALHAHAQGVAAAARTHVNTCLPFGRRLEGGHKPDPGPGRAVRGVGRQQLEPRADTCGGGGGRDRSGRAERPCCENLRNRDSPTCHTRRCADWRSRQAAQPPHADQVGGLQPRCNASSCRQMAPGRSPAQQPWPPPKLTYVTQRVTQIQCFGSAAAPVHCSRWWVAGGMVCPCSVREPRKATRGSWRAVQLRART